MNKVSIVILNYNGKRFLEQFLPDVVSFSTGEGVKVYVADNASIDDSVAFLKNNFPQVELIILDHNYGYTGGYNRALKYIKADYFILLNSDVHVSLNWLERNERYSPLNIKNNSEGIQARSNK